MFKIQNFRRRREQDLGEKFAGRMLKVYFTKVFS